MERVGTLNHTHHHVIDITTTTQQQQHHPSPSRSTLNRQDHAPSTSVTASNANAGVSRNNASSFANHGQRSPLNSGYWLCTELVITLSQIIAAVVVLCSSRDERPEAPLFTWVIGYACGCVASLPLLLWRWFNRNRLSDQDPAQPAQGSSTPRFLTAVLLSAR